MKRNLFAFFFSVLALVWSCDKSSPSEDNEITPTGEVSSITLHKSAVDVEVGQTAYVDVGLTPDMSAEGNIRVSSSDAAIAGCSVKGSQVVVTGKKKGTCTVTVSAASGGATSQMLSVTVWNPGERKVVSVKSIEVTLSEAEIRTNDSYGDPITCRVTLTPVTDGETPTLEDLDYSIGSPSVLEVKDWNPTKGTFKLAAKTKSAASSTVTLFPVGKSASDPAAKKITIPIRKEIKEGIFVVQDDWKHIDSKGTFLLTAGETIDLSSSTSPVTVQLKYYDDEIVKVSEDGGDFALESTERYSTSTNGLKIWLTARELEVIHLSGEGLSNSGIADRLHVSVYTIKNHKQNIYLKMDVRSNAEMIRRANQLGIV